MGKRVCVIDIPGLSKELLSAVPATSSLGRWLSGQRVSALAPTFPALTCSVQASLTTGTPPANHGIIANGMATFRSREDQQLVDASSFPEYRRDVSFWEQSNQLVQQRRFWQDDSGARKWKTALLFFQNSMPGFDPVAQSIHTAADIVITPKPLHGADGKIISTCWSSPTELYPNLAERIGTFPIQFYWGPMARIDSSRWIAQAARAVWDGHSPQLQLVYIPHLDYDLQRFGPESDQAALAVAEMSEAIGPLIDAILASRGELVVLSEYSMRSVSRFVQPNRMLAAAGLLTTRESADGRLIDYARSAAFAMVDHQIAHVFVRNRAQLKAVKSALKHIAIASIDAGPSESRHRRSGDLVLQASADAWFDYRWWDQPSDAATFAKAVDIHRKPGYDPLELFFDPQIGGVSQDPSRVRGSHGTVNGSDAVFISSIGDDQIRVEDVSKMIAALIES